MTAIATPIRLGSHARLLANSDRCRQSRGGFTLAGEATLVPDGDSSREQPAVSFFAGATGT
jgi:hypothetical protein